MTTENQQKNTMTVIPIGAQAWDRFVDSSLQGTVFNKSFFLESFKLPVEYLICSKGEEPIAGFAAIKTPSGIALMPYLVYNGILLRDFKEYKQYRRVETSFSAMEALAQYLAQQYEQVDFVNHWSVTDMRAFEGFNFHERDKGYYKVTLSYSSHLDISNAEDTSGYARARIRDLQRETAEINWKTEESNDIDLLIRLHDKTFQRNETMRSPMAQRSLKDVCEAVFKANAGKIYVTYQQQQPVAASLFVYDCHRAYHLVLGTEDHAVNSGVGTKNFYDSCVMLRRTLGIQCLDLVGINNPQRARYKLSYGGNVVPYFRVTKTTG